MKDILKGIFRFQRGQAMFNLIKHDEQRRPVSVRFGVLSIVQSLIALAIACLAFLFSAMDNGNAGQLIIIVIAIVVGISDISLYLSSLINMSRQCHLNKTWATYTSIVMFIVCLVGSIVIVAINVVQLM